MLRPIECFRCLMYLAFLAIANNLSAATDSALDGKLEQLVEAVAEGDQSTSSKRWMAIVDDATSEDLVAILTAMNSAQNVGPLAENWIRAAVDAVAERELRGSGGLPTAALEAFVLAEDQHPRARRVAYEWLLKVDEPAAARLLPQMLDDVSLEMRYDAIGSLLTEADEATDEETKLQKYQRAFASARDKTQFQQAADALKTLGQTPDMAGQFGFLKNWKVVGPFDNTDREGFDNAYLSPNSIDLAAEYSGKHGPVVWKDAVAELDDFDDLGMVDFNAALVEEKSVLGYALTTFVSSKAQSVECRYESKLATKLWINGEEVAVKNVYHSGGGFDQYIVPCQFKAGANAILIKVCQNEQTQPWTKPWEFRLRITDSLGGAVQQASAQLAK
ncbi:MAG: hypothetical protein AAGD11_13845 [Planctomycetota bacterium]